MKKLFTLSVFSFVFNAVFSQISLSLTDMPVAGQSQRLGVDTLPMPAINFGSKGANQLYDFSNLSVFKYDTVEFRTPTAGQLSTCPNADVALTVDGVNFLLTNNDQPGNKISLEGFEGLINGNVLNAAYSTKPDIYRFPTAYQSNFSGTGYLQKTVPGSQVGQPLATSVELTISTTYTDTVDGWGRVKTPVGTYDCLRKQRKETTNTVIRALIFGTWSNISNTTSTTIRYTYPTKETKGTAMNFTFDSLNNVISASWSTLPPTTPVANFGYTSGGGGLIFFTDSTDGYPDSYTWDFGDGTNGNTQNPNHTYTANGAYWVCLNVLNAGGSTQYCDSVYVTGITAANNAPIAVTDTVSLLQATSITIFHVATNDVDPDGDNICMTDVWGSPYVTEYIGGSCDMVTIAPDTCFTGTFTFSYKICDNGNPVLCDTGLVTVTVTPDANYDAIADFSLATALYQCNTLTVNNSSQNYSSSVWTVREFFQTQTDTIVSDTLNYIDFTPGSFHGEICVTVANQCQSDVRCDTLQTVCESISETSLSNISIYPNPANNFLTIDMSNNEDEITRNYTAIEIFNSLGEKVIVVGDNTNNGKTITISVAELPAGMYNASIVDAKGTRRTLGRFTKE